MAANSQNPSCIGYDFRVWPPCGSFSADATEWADHEAALEKAYVRSSVTKNSFQLAHVTSRSGLNDLLGITADHKDAKLIGIEAGDQVIAAKSRTWGPEPACCSSFDENWDFWGYDVCDVDGLFSFLQMEVDGWNDLRLFPKEDIEGALALTQAANILIPSHAPFVAIGLWLYRG